MNKVRNRCKPFLIIILLPVLILLTSFDMSQVTIIQSAPPSSNVPSMHAADPDNIFNVMTYNIRHGRGMDDIVNLDRIVDIIRRSDAEIVALQEVDRFHPRSFLRDEVRYIASKLQMNWSFASSFMLGFMEYGNAVLSVHPIVHAEHHYLGGIVEPRSMLEVTIDRAGQELTVFATHLGVYAHERPEQMRLMMQRLEAFAHDKPAIWLGDFNMEKSDPLLETAAKHWHSPSVEAPTAIGKEIDHIFLNRHIKSMDAYTIPSTASDHHPAIVTIMLTKPVNDR